MSDSEDDFASADEGEVDVGTKKEDAKGKGSKEVTVAATADSKLDTEKPKQNSGDHAGKKGAAQKGGSKGKEQQKKKGGASGKAAESKNAAKSTDKLGDNVTKSKAQGRNSKGKKGSQKVPSNTDKDSEQVKVDSKVKHSQPSTDENVKGESAVLGESGESEQAVKEKPVIVASTETDDTPEPEKAENAIADSSEEILQTPVKQTDISASGSSSKEAEEATLLQSPSSQSITRPGPDHTTEQESVLTKLAEAATEKKSGWGWGWGSSLLDVASSSVSTFTSQVGEGFHTMIETVESTLNVPDPEEMAEKNVKSSQGPEESPGEAQEAEEPSDEVAEKTSETVTSESSEASAGDQPKASDSDNWFSSWGVSNITKIVENTSKTLVTGGLDVLETIGKKTFDVINDHDPGLKKTRGLVKDRGDKPNLSSVLRDAKEQYEVRVEQEKESEEARKSHFGALFDDFQGLAHLEALEMLSNQSEKQVNTLLGALSPDQVGALKPQLLQIKQNFEIEEEEDQEEEEHDQDFVKLVTDALADLSIPTSPVKLTKTREKIYESLTKAQGTDDDESSVQPKEVHQVAIQSLAEFTSRSIEHFHKFGELVLLHRAKLSDFVSTSKQLHSLTKILCSEVSIISTKYTDTLNRLEGGQEALAINQFVTNIYLEASNSCSYVQDSFQLLLPVLQQAAMEHCQSLDS